MSLALAGGAVGPYLDRPLFTLLLARRPETTPLPSTVMWLSILSAAAGIYASSRTREPLRAVMVALALFAVTIVPATSPAALQIRGDGLRSFFSLHLPGAELVLGITVCTLVLLIFGFLNFRPEPWLWEKSGGRAFRWLIVAGLFLAVGFW